jgi:hypothetical protein
MTHPPPARNHDRGQPVIQGAGQRQATPAQVRDHVATLLQASTFQAVADAARVGQMTVWEIAHATRPAIRHQTARALLAVQPADLQPRRADANGAMWQLRSLVAMGHTTGRITTALGSADHIVTPLVRGDRATITTVLRDDITRLFDAWWDKRPPRRTPQEKTAACKALQRAAVHNWPCPAALDEDELDQPGYTPTARWRYAHGIGIAADDPLGKHRPTGHRGGHAPRPTGTNTKPADQAKASIVPGPGA